MVLMGSLSSTRPQAFHTERGSPTGCWAGMWCPWVESVDLASYTVSASPPLVWISAQHSTEYLVLSLHGKPHRGRRFSSTKIGHAYSLSGPTPALAMLWFCATVERNSSSTAPRSVKSS